ncbi:MAG: hypothetical protein HYW90_01285 [Candidatus Sungbacteria bacterium]|nr:hypothetical protein [Candidatus Sungbacteria bacterium]
MDLMDLKEIEKAFEAVVALPTIAIVERPRPAAQQVTTGTPKPAPVKRVLADEVKRDALTEKFLTALAERKNGLREAEKKHDDAAAVSFREQIAVVMAKIRSLPEVYSAFIAGLYTLPEAHEVIDDLIARGIMRGVDDAEKQANRTAWDEWKPKMVKYEAEKADYDAMYGAVVEKGDEEADIPDAPRPPAKPQTIWSLPVVGNTRAYRHFAKRYFGKDEPKPEGYDPKVADTLIGAWVTHQRVTKETYAEKREASEALLAKYREQFKPVEGKTLADLDAGQLNIGDVVEFVLKREQDFKDTRSGYQLEGTGWVRYHGVDGQGIAKGELLGAVGSVWPGLARFTAKPATEEREARAATLFQWKLKYSFDGMQAMEDGRPMVFLMVLFRKAGGWKFQSQTPAGDQRQFKPQTPRYHRSDEDRGPRQAKGRKGGKGGRGRRGDSSRQDDE